MIIAQFIAVVVIGYLLGSISFGALVSKHGAKADIRKQGSGKTGATNVFRMFGLKAGIMVAAFDLLKAALAVFIAQLIFSESYSLISTTSLWNISRIAQILAGLAAVAGHTWPVFHKFKGGRGVAPFLGALFVLYWPAAIFGSLILLSVAASFKYVSLGSIVGVVGTYALLVPLTILYEAPIEYIVYCGTGATFIIWMHRDNISRLLAGTERRLGRQA